ncbi:hypothetical protein SAMN04487996_104400 [Dyadobacter soli]|uniref:Uncharacterized protein n=1 Tax=Dyadobacter soli TaxID=659014 RepID=A0A1G7C4U2_9BACT|nr:hypothetical protein [Dyadobacter soli]SDE34319.1 hypothetical protein SAMN04487996_104400 [Dyadobacter soli]
MKNKLHRSITILMAFLVLLSSTGFVLTERQCAMMASKSMQLVGKSKENSCKPKVVSSCCAKSASMKMTKGKSFQKAACCKESQKLEKLNVASVDAQVLAKLLKSVATGVTWSVTRYQFIRAEWTLPSSPDFPDISFSSRLHGRSMLAFIQSFLI